MNAKLKRNASMTRSLELRAAFEKERKQAVTMSRPAGDGPVPQLPWGMPLESAHVETGHCIRDVNGLAPAGLYRLPTGRYGYGAWSVGLHSPLPIVPPGAMAGQWLGPRFSGPHLHAATGVHWGWWVWQEEDTMSKRH